MATIVCPATSRAANPLLVGEFTCGACVESFATGDEQRLHAKTERHLYNTKRRLANLKPISQELWDIKVAEARAADGGQRKGVAHLKEREKASRTGSSVETASQQDSANGENVVKSLEPFEWTPFHSLFDKRGFGTIDICLRYMRRKYDFVIPDQQYCLDVPALLTFLYKKINNAPHRCTFCGKKFPDAMAVRQHMLDMRHCRVGSGPLNEKELEKFYDFTASTLEVTEYITNPKQKLESLLRFFDVDRDGYLSQEEIAAFWEAMTSGTDHAGSVLTNDQYHLACTMAGADPSRGFDVEQFSVLYKENLHDCFDLNAHFERLRELLTKKLLKRAANTENAPLETLVETNEETDVPLETLVETNEETDVGDEVDDGDDDDDDDEESEADSEGTDILECDDMEEFEEVMRVLGLQQVTISDTGDLRLPNGGYATHRDVQHIYKQRGVRLSEQQQIVVADGSRQKCAAHSAFRSKAKLMLKNDTNHNGCQIATMTQRQAALQGRKVIAILKKQTRNELSMAMKTNFLITKRRTKIRTGMGDMSNGR